MANIPPSAQSHVCNMDPGLLEALREGFEHGRLAAGISERQAATLQKTVNDVLEERGFARISLGMSRHKSTLKRELQSDAEAMTGNLPNLCEFLLSGVDDDFLNPTSPDCRCEAVILRDDYNPRNSHRREAKRDPHGRFCLHSEEQKDDGCGPHHAR